MTLIGTISEKASPGTQFVFIALWWYSIHTYFRFVFGNNANAFRAARKCHISPTALHKRYNDLPFVYDCPVGTPITLKIEVLHQHNSKCCNM